MSRPEFLARMSEILDIEPGVLVGSERLEDLPEWNSMAMVSFIAFADEQFEKTLSPRLFSTCNTVNDLGDLAGVAK